MDVDLLLFRKLIKSIFNAIRSPNTTNKENTNSCCKTCIKNDKLQP
jgi:hypothetical protein